MDNKILITHYFHKRRILFLLVFRLWIRIRYFWASRIRKYAKLKCPYTDNTRNENVRILIIREIKMSVIRILIIREIKMSVY
jgi:hypothetical protein